MRLVTTIRIVKDDDAVAKWYSCFVIYVLDSITLSTDILPLKIIKYIEMKEKTNHAIHEYQNATILTFIDPKIIYCKIKRKLNKRTKSKCQLNRTKGHSFPPA